jgi:hypothetical protein
MNLGLSAQFNQRPRYGFDRVEKSKYGHVIWNERL